MNRIGVERFSNKERVSQLTEQEVLDILTTLKNVVRIADIPSTNINFIEKRLIGRGKMEEAVKELTKTVNTMMDQVQGTIDAAEDALAELNKVQKKL